MDSLSIVGLGVVGSFGVGRAALAESLAKPPGAAPGTVAVYSGGRTLEWPAHRVDTGPLDTFIPRRAIRRADAFSRMALLGACLALEDAGLPRADLGGGTALVIASAQGATGSTLALLDSMIADGDAFSSPTHFAHSLHNSAAATLSILMGIQGPNLTVSQGWNSVPSALLSARTLLRTGQVSRVLFGAVEELSEIPALLWHQTAPGQVAGEGAVFMVLEAEGPPDRPRLVELLTTDGGVSGDRDAWGFELDSGSSRWDLADRFGLSQALPAFHLATACLLLSGAVLHGHPGGPSGAVACRWRTPAEGSASCRVVGGPSPC